MRDYPHNPNRIQFVNCFSSIILRLGDLPKKRSPKVPLRFTISPPTYSVQYYMLHECLFLQFNSLALPITAATAACAAVGGAATGFGMLTIQMLQHQKKGNTDKQTVRTEFRFRGGLSPLQRGVRAAQTCSIKCSRSNQATPAAPSMVWRVP